MSNNYVYCSDEREMASNTFYLNVNIHNGICFLFDFHVNIKSQGKKSKHEQEHVIRAKKRSGLPFLYI
ncbi:hypothetical protein LguiA_023536 [Lonicera macranthoides]